MRRRLATVLSVMAAALLALPAHAQSATWTTLATTSGTLVPGSLCTTDGKDLTCNQSLSGLMSPDRITSGTTSMLAISNTGYISLTQSGVNTAYFHPSLGLVTVGVSSTGGISGTTGYFSGKVGIFTAQPDANFVMTIGDASNAYSNLSLRRNAGGEPSILFSSGSNTGASATQLRGLQNGGLRVTDGSGTAEYMRIVSSGVGIGTRSPTTSLEVSGTVSATHFVGDGSGLTGTQATVASGTSGSLVYRDQNGGLVASSSLTISATTGSVGVGAAAPTGLGNNALYAVGSLGTAGNFVVYNSDQIFNSAVNAQSLIWGGSSGGVKITGDGRSGQNYLSFITSGTGVMWIVSSGNVGIGTATPKTKLDVGSSSMKLGSEAQYIGFNMYYDGSAASWRNSSPNLHYAMIRIGQTSLGEGGDIQFTTNASSSTPTLSDDPISISKRMIIRRAGDVRMGSLYVGSLSITPTTSVEVSGTVSATRFVGDGSGLTNISGASADRIVSGTTSMLAISNTGYISVTQSGVNTAYFHPSMGLVTIGVSSTGGISGTTGYFSEKLGIGTTDPSSSIDSYASVNGTVYARISNANTGTGARTRLTLGAISGTYAYLNLNGTNYPTDPLALSIASPFTGEYPIIFSTGGQERMRLKSGFVGLGTSTPTTALEVSGTVSTTDVRFSGNATLPTGKCASATDEGRMVMTADGPYVCLLR